MKADDKIDGPVDPKLLMSSMVSVERHCMFVAECLIQIGRLLLALLAVDLDESPSPFRWGVRVLVLLKMCCH